ncbi:MAG TPA: hypothetical protein VEC99_17845, partial [Clostridia bacterium]|nr:hypothetical protein [Clostridia bacterium]
EPQEVFAGSHRMVTVLCRNEAEETVRGDLHIRLYQLSSATAAPFDSSFWKSLEVLPGQTVIETVRLTLPSVRAETRFLLQWLEGTNKVLGATELVVYPADLLKELRKIAGGQPVGVYDPQNQLKPLLKSVDCEFYDLEHSEVAAFSGKLAIVGPFAFVARIGEGLDKLVRTLAWKGVGVVWFQPSSKPGSRRKPSFFSVPEGKSTVVVAQAELTVDLAERPGSQLNLLQLAQEALNPAPLALPNFAAQPQRK